MGCMWAQCGGAGSVPVDPEGGAERANGAGARGRCESPRCGGCQVGARVILSDNARTPLCLENCRRSCESNGLQHVEVLASPGVRSPQIWFCFLSWTSSWGQTSSMSLEISRTSW
ncbi:hypothetical protein INR49_010086 [Caranx melampygus]|nr:hypothetical protein INR49_010086 [Caranx melampygus]